MKYLELKFWSYYVTTWFKILVYISDYLFHLPRWFQILCSKNLHSYNSRWRQCGSLFLNALYKDRLGLKKKLYSLDLMSHIKVYDTTFVAIAFEAWTFFIIQEKYGEKSPCFESNCFERIVVCFYMKNM